jgi:hypothetical protein
VLVGVWTRTVEDWSRWNRYLVAVGVNGLHFVSVYMRGSYIVSFLSSRLLVRMYHIDRRRRGWAGKAL